MKGIPESTVEEIKARIDLTDLISSYGIQVKTVGASKKACCPFHHEKTPSFHINESRGFYHCFGCGESGDAIKFVEKMEGLSFVEAVKKLAQQCGMAIEEKEDPTAGRRKRLFALMAELAQFYHRCLKQSKEAEVAREYLKSRDLGDEVQEKFLIGYAPVGVAPIMRWAEKHGYTGEELDAAGVVKPPRDASDSGYHRFGGRLMFSIRDKQGRVVAFSGRQLVASKKSGKYVNSPETLIFKKSNVLFGFDLAARNIANSAHREAIVCEGQIDTIRLHMSGFPVAVASQGTAFTEEHVKMLKKVADQVALVFDDDAAGHKATIRTAGLMLAESIPVRVVSLPGGDDPDSFLRSHPPEDFQRLLDGAESIMRFQVRAERAKERDPGSIDAVNRVSRAVLATVAQAKGEVIRAAMLGEAAQLMGLPVAALVSELANVKVPKTPAVRVEERPVPDDDQASAEGEAGQPQGESECEDAAEAQSLRGEDAAEQQPPPPREMAFMQFLMGNEYDEKLDRTIGEYLPPEVFVHDFTRRFLEAWRQEIATGSDVLREFASALSPKEGKWFDEILLNGGKAEASGMSAEDIMQSFVRALWSECLRRRRGSLPAVGDSATETERLRLTLEIKRILQVKWDSLKDIIDSLTTGGNGNGS